MRLFKKREEEGQDQTTVLLARAVILTETFEDLTEEIKNNNAKQDEIIRVLNDMSANMKEFIEVIRHFFALEASIRKEEAKREALRLQETEETPGDRKY